MVKPFKLKKSNFMKKKEKDNNFYYFNLLL